MDMLSVNRRAPEGVRPALVDLLRESNVHRGGPLVVPAEYLEVVITK